MDLNNIVFLVVIGTSLTFVIGHPSDTRTSAVSTESDTEQLSWLNDLESQIFSDPGELSLFDSPNPLLGKSKQPEPAKKVIGEKDYDTADLIEEPLVVTERPYLLGPNHVTSKVSSSVETEVNDEESNESTTNIDTSDIYDADTTTVSPINEDDTQESNRKDKPTFISSDHGYLVISTSEKANEDLVSSSRNNEMRAPNNSYHVLDKILLEMYPLSKPSNSDSLKKSSNTKYDNNGTQQSEVKSFVMLIVNQTWFIVLGCILVSLFCGAFLFVIFRLRKKLSDRSAITLISHIDYDNSNPTQNIHST